MVVRLGVYTYVVGDAPWPTPLQPFGVRNNRDVRYRQKAVGEYTADPAYFIGIVSPAQFQPATPIEYTHFGTTVRYVTVTVAGTEEVRTNDGGAVFEVLIVAPEFPGVFRLPC